ncbi:TIGR03087 family PEP-CTERM/XrtA system glycosyltransferase [Roseimaritima multifibrata]|nr:TIGR03087 family PEP-CTERM/XrtA system glycosyltransferase [Roseimaritima multifibrata]
MTTKPSLLMLTHRVPYPPDRGDRIRAWNILQHLAKTHRVSLGCLTDEPVTPETQEKLRSVCYQFEIVPVGPRTRWVRAGMSAARGRSLTEGLFWSPKLKRVINKWARTEEFDALWIYCSSMLKYASSSRLTHIRRFVDLVDVDSEKFFQYAQSASPWKRAIYRTEARRVRRLEHHAARTSAAVTLVSEAEADVLRQTIDSQDYPIHGIPNGVDVDYFAPLTEQAQPDLYAQRQKRSSVPLTDPRFVFVGVLNYQPNVEGITWFADNVWEKVIQQYPEATLSIVGKHPGAAIKQLGDRPGIKVIGQVPDVRPAIYDADIVVVPLQIARGVQNKVLEAMAMGMPVIATPAAATGIGATSGEDLLVASTPEQWQQSIQAVCADPQHRRRIANAARKCVCTKHTWQAALSGMQSLITQDPNSP